mgnify:FL=1
MNRSFEQTLKEVTVQMEIPSGGTAKQFKIQAGPTRLVVTYKGETIVEGDLYAPVHEDESTWYIEDGKVLNIVLDKRKNTEWWPHVLTTDPKIDVKKIKPESSKLSDLDGETRATVEKMMFDQRQKSAEEQRKHQLLEKFKREHPELDFSQVDKNKTN